MILYVVALLMSPVAVWTCGRGPQAWLNLGLWLLGLLLLINGFVTAILVPVVDALFVVYGYYTEKRLRSSDAGTYQAMQEFPTQLSNGIIPVADSVGSGRRVVA